MNFIFNKNPISIKAKYYSNIQ